MKSNAFLAGVIATGLLAIAGSASAATEMVSKVAVYSWDTVSSATGPFTGPYVSTGIVFTIDPSGLEQLVFCVDLEHDIYVQNYSPSLLFTLGTLDVTGGGVAISEAVSNQIGQLANIGIGYRAANAANLADQLDAVQAAIWSLEYGETFVSANASINTMIASLTAGVHDNGGGRAFSLIAHGLPDANGVLAPGVQSMVYGGPPLLTHNDGPGVPEPASWALMLVGFGGLGGVLRRRRTYRLVEIAADSSTASETFRADDDESALVQALDVAEGKALEIWRDGALVARRELASFAA